MTFPNPGEIFVAKYRVERLLGSGGFSRVYQAMQVDLERKVALKILRPSVGDFEDVHKAAERLNNLSVRFHREAKMVSKLRSPHTIIMYDYGRSEDTGLLFMVMEYVDGVTLSQLVAKRGPIEPKRVVQILRQVLTSLHEAHTLEMLHRDLKPQNIMVFDHLGKRDQVKLLDFGIVKLMNDARREETRDLTDDGSLVGTPRYMAPEYIRGEALGPAADIYSLGLVMYELLVGEQAIQVDSSIQIIAKQLERKSFFLPPHLDLSEDLRAIINRMLHKDTAYRYTRAASILEDLEGITNQEPTAYRFSRVPHPGVDPLDNDTKPVVLRPAEFGASLERVDEFLHEQGASTRPKKLALVGGLLAALAAILVAALSFASLHSSDPTEVTASPREPMTRPLKESAPRDTPADQEPPPAHIASDEPIADVEPEPVTFAIRSEAGTTILINGTELGRSPVTVDASKFTFPIQVEARLGTRKFSVELDEPIDTAIALPDAPPPKEELRTRRRTKRRADSKTSSSSPKPGEPGPKKKRISIGDL
ncbi:MAG: serine/threonine-protein kinase [Myxococcota bacterium]